MFFCRVGKDRTGLVAMFALHIMGASDEAIIEDFHRSAGLCLPNALVWLLSVGTKQS
jgi:hypothetical protein